SRLNGAASAEALTMIEPPLPAARIAGMVTASVFDTPFQMDVDDILALPGGDRRDRSPDGHDAGVGTRCPGGLVRRREMSRPRSNRRGHARQRGTGWRGGRSFRPAPSFRQDPPGWPSRTN